RPVEQLSCRAHERVAFDVLAVTGLLADEDDVGVRAAFAEDGLSAALPERACPAAGSRFTQLLYRRTCRNQRRGGAVAVELELAHASALPGRRRYYSCPRRRGRVVRQRPAKPRTPVRLRSAPSRSKSGFGCAEAMTTSIGSFYQRRW